MTAEVLPAIRKTGRYEAPTAPARPSAELTMRQRRQYLAEVTECRMTQGIAPARLLWDHLGFMTFPDELLDPLDPKSRRHLPSDGPSDDWRRALAHLMIHRLEDPAGGRHPIPVWIAAAAGRRGGPDFKAACGILRRWGLRVEGRGEAARLIVANQHHMLSRLFLGTPWEDSDWKRALSKVPGAFATANPANFGGVKARAYSLPLTAIPDLDEDEEDEL